MKVLRIPLLALIISMGMHPVCGDPFAPRSPDSDSKKKTFRVSKVGTDKTELLAIYRAVNESGVAAGFQDFKADAFKVVFRISETEFLVYPMHWRTVTLGGSSNRLGLGAQTNSHRSLVIDDTQIYHLTTVRPLDVIDGEKITGLSVQATGEILEHDDRDILYGYGAVRVLREAVARKMTKEEFVSRLRDGETWTLRNFTTEVCRNCLGRGDLGKLRDHAQCLECRGTGDVAVDYVVKW